MKKIFSLFAIATATYAGTGCDIPVKWNFGYMPFYENRYKQDSSYNDQGDIVPLKYGENGKVVKIGSDSLIYDENKMTIINNEDNLIREIYNNIDGNDSTLLYVGTKLIFKTQFSTSDSIASKIQYEYGVLKNLDSIVKQKDGSVIRKKQYYRNDEWQFYIETCKPSNDSCNCKLDTITADYPFLYVNRPLYVYENGFLKQYNGRDIYYSIDSTTQTQFDMISNYTNTKVVKFYRLNGQKIKSMPNKR